MCENVHISHINFEDSQNLLQMPDQLETCRVCKVTIPANFESFAAPIRFYKSSNGQDKMCVGTFSQIQSIGCTT